MTVASLGTIDRTAVSSNPARRAVTIPGSFQMTRGGHLRDPAVAYETWGALDGRRSNAVVLFTGISASTHAASSPEDPKPGWWESMIGRGRPIDTQEYFVICVNSLGSCFGSTGPSSIDPETGLRYALRFPALAIEDIAEAAAHVINHLGIERVHAIVGPSMGGLAALALQSAHQLSDRLLLISCAANATPAATALRTLQRKILCMDPLWNGGNYVPHMRPLNGMRIARMLGMFTYRSPAEWLARFGRSTAARNSRERAFDPDISEVETYLEERVTQFSLTFDPNSYLYLSAACDSFDFAPVASTYARPGLLLCEEALVVGVGTDQLFPLHQQRELVGTLEPICRAVELVELPSIQGHDAFLADTERLGPYVERFLRAH